MVRFGVAFDTARHLRRRQHSHRPRAGRKQESAVMLARASHTSEPLNRRAAIAETHAQVSTTETEKARMTRVVMTPILFDPTAIPAKAAKKSTPVAIE